MAIVTQNNNLNIQSGSVPVTVHLSQGDVGNTLGFYIYNGSEPVLMDGLQVSVHGIRSDGVGFGPFTVTTRANSNYVTFNIRSVMAAVMGAALAELTITNGSGASVGTANFAMLVEQGTFPDGPVYSTDISVYQQILNYVQTIPASVRSDYIARITAETNARESADQTLQSNINAEASTRATQDASLQSQINQLIAPSGEAPSAAEVENARIGADGTTYHTLGDAIRGQVTDIKNALSESTENLFDLSKIKADGITNENGVLTGKASSFYLAYDESKGGLPLNITFEAHGKYMFSLKAKNTGTGLNGIGLTFGFHYTDGTMTETACPNSATEFTSFSVVADTSKTVEMAYIAYNSVGDNVWQLKELIIVNAAVDIAYMPSITATDYIARHNVGLLQITDEIAKNNALQLGTLTNHHYVSDSLFEYGNVVLDNTNYIIYNDSTSRVRTKKGICLPLKSGTVIDCTTGVFYIGYIGQDGHVVSPQGWRSTYTLPADLNCYMVLRENPESTITDISGFLGGLSITPPRDNDMQGVANNIGKALDVLRFNKFYDHLLLNKINGDNVVIPLQSIPSIYMSKRLGFRVIEANVKETSDDQYIVTHGTNGAFGAMFEHVDGSTDISSVLINSVTMTWIKENVRYKSVYGKYRTAPPTLQEYLSVCKELGMIPLVQIRDDANVVSIANEIMGKDNYIAYDSTRDLNSGFIMNVRNYTTKAEIVNECESMGHPFIYFMADPSSFSDSDLADIIRTLHALGYTIGFQDTFISEQDASKYIQMGFDVCATTWNINDIDCGNEWNVSGDVGYSDFDTTGTVDSDGNLVLSDGQYVRKWGAAQKFLVGQVVYVRFNGTLKVNMSGNFRSGTYTSNGSEYVRISCGALNGYAEFMLTSVGNTTVYELNGKASIL